MEKKDFYEGEYMPQMHKIGKLTGLLGAVLSFLPALVLAVVYGLLPKPAVSWMNSLEPVLWNSSMNSLSSLNLPLPL